MSQLSRPYQFGLLGVVLLAIVWMLFLRPSEEVPLDDTPIPGVAATPPATGAAPAAATPAASATPAAPAPATAAPTPAVSGGTPATTASDPGWSSAPAAKTSKTKVDPSRPILDAVAKGKVAVVLFFQGGAAEDAAVRESVRAVPRRGGRVVVFSVPIADVGLYSAITRGVSVLTAPTVLVIGADRSASAIDGFTDTDEIDELVRDALTRHRGVSDAGTPAPPVTA